jgi:chlorophyll synthase
VRGIPLAAPVDLLALARPWFWPVSLVPYHLGYVLATRTLAPSAGELLGALVAVLADNDAYDVAGDRLNPRRARSPLVTGRITVPRARRIALAAGTVALVAALPLGPLFVAGVAGTLLSSRAYSAPPLRWKQRAGADVALNAVAVGALCPLAGWLAAGRAVAGFPWPVALLATFVAAALYVPTTLVDHDADAAAGYRTVAVRLGPRRAYRLGLAAWVAAAALAAPLAATGTVLPRRMLAAELVLGPALVVAYHLLLRRGATIARIAVVAGLFGVPCVAFAVWYAAPNGFGTNG